MTPGSFSNRPDNFFASRSVAWKEAPAGKVISTINSGRVDGGKNSLGTNGLARIDNTNRPSVPPITIQR